MKSITRLCMLMLVSMFAVTVCAEEAETRGKTEKCILQKVCSIDARLQCNNAISFGSADINKPGGYVITQPGIYCLKEDVVFNPTLSPIAPATPTPPYDYLAPTTVQAAITIRSSNVVVLLGDHRLSQAGAGTSTQIPYCVGIVIPDVIPNDPDINSIGLQSIYIKGGDPAIIDGFSMMGIRVFGHCYDIRLSNITIKNCAELASQALRPVVYGFPYFPHNAPTTPGFGPSFSVAGLAIGETGRGGAGPVWFADLPDTEFNTQNRNNEIILENVSCLNNFQIGLRCPNAFNVTINNCHFNETWSDDVLLNPFGATFTANGQHPFIPQTANVDPSLYNAVISNSTFNDTTYRGDFTTIVDSAFPIAGCTTTHSKNVVWNNCQFNGTTCTFVNVSADVDVPVCGFLSSGIEDNTFNDCHFDDCTAIGSINGFHMSGTQATVADDITFKSSRNVRFINCTSNNHKSIGDQRLPAPVLPPAPDSVLGFAIFFAKDVVLEGCVSQDLVTRGPNNLLATNVSGFLLGANAAQFPPLPDATVQNITYRNCIASRCFALNGGAAGGWNLQTASAGIGLDAQKATVLENCISSCNQTFTPTLTTPGIVQGPAFGFLVLDATVITPEQFNSVPTVFQGCKALHNKGLPQSPSGTIRYTSGFYISRDVRTSLVDCDAIDNIYGFFLNNASRCTVRNSRSDNNILPGVIQTVAVGVGGTGYAVGNILNIVSGTNTTGRVTVSSVAAGVITGVTLLNSGSGYTAGTFPTTGGTGTGATITITVANIGEGFTDVGPTGTPAAPGLSTSYFEANTAYMNGISPTAGPGVGPNLNYNVFYASGPLATVRTTLSSQTYTFNNGPTFAGVPIYTPNYNLSTVN